ncbi:MAG: hypothetical protein GQF41_3637 [Candidatus Rifleibacterium amylolyticum]|nr:MAG: hypothetical protein GQF41_3637 [Candidatus Rifleibacterium amylolyticum]
MQRHNFGLMLYLFVFFFTVYVMTSSVITIDLFDVSIMRLEVLKAIYERFDLNVPAGSGVVGIDGRDYSWFGIGSVLLFLPFYALARIADISPNIVLSILNPLFSAATAAMVCYFCLSTGYSRKQSVFASLVYGVGTMAWYYSKDPGDHSLETFFLLLSTLSMYKYIKSEKGCWLVLSGFSLGIGGLVRPTSFMLALPLMLMLLANCNKVKRISECYNVIFRSSVILVACLLPFLSIFLWYNNYRFGSIFESGYSLIAARAGVSLFSKTSFFTGLAGLLVSPGKGFFFYSPITLLFFFYFKPFWKKHQELGTCFISTIIIYVIFFSKYLYWHGDWAWGPRFLFVLTPFLVIPIVELFESKLWQEKGLIRNATLFLLLISILIQIISVSVHTYRYFVYIQTDKNVKFTVDKGVGAPPVKEPAVETYFNWKLSPILLQAGMAGDIMLATLAGRKADISSNPETESGVTKLLHIDCLDFWWHYIYYFSHNWLILLVVPILGFIALVSAYKVLTLIQQ